MRKWDRMCDCECVSVFDIHRAPSLFTLGINRWKVKGNTREGRRERGPGPDCYLPCRETCLPGVFFKKKKKKRHFSQQLFGSCQAAVTGKYIRLDLVCFGCFGDAAIMRDRGLVMEQAGHLDSFSSSQPVLHFVFYFYFEGTFFLFCFYFTGVYADRANLMVLCPQTVMCKLLQSDPCVTFLALSGSLWVKETTPHIRLTYSLTAENNMRTVVLILLPSIHGGIN